MDNQTKCEPKAKTKKNLKWYMENTGPAAIMSMCIMGAGTMSSLIKTGSAYSYTFLWAVILSAVFAVIAVWLPTKVTCVTGLAPDEAITKYAGRWVAWALVLLSSLTQFCVVIFQGRGQSSAISTIITAATGNEASPVLLFFLNLLVVGGVCYIFYFAKNAQSLKKAIQIVISFMIVCFLITFIFLIPTIEWKQLFGGLLPRVTPEAKPLLDMNQIVPCLAAIFGGAANLSVLIYHGYAIKTSKWDHEDRLEAGKWDSIFHNGILFGLFSVLVYIVSAAAIYPTGTAATSVAQAATALTPIMGKFSSVVFSLGWMCAVATTMSGCAFIVVTPILFMLGNDISLENKKYRLWLTVCTIIPAVFLSPLLRGEAITLLSKAMQLNAVVTPPGILVYWYLTSSKKVLGSKRNGVALNIVVGIMFVISCYLCIGAFKSVFLA